MNAPMSNWMSGRVAASAIAGRSGRQATTSSRFIVAAAAAIVPPSFRAVRRGRTGPGVWVVGAWVVACCTSMLHLRGQ